MRAVAASLGVGAGVVVVAATFAVLQPDLRQRTIQVRPDVQAQADAVGGPASTRPVAKQAPAGARSSVAPAVASDTVATTRLPEPHAVLAGIGDAALPTEPPFSSTGRPEVAESGSITTGSSDEGVLVFYQGRKSGTEVALTFDDGPSRENTPRILAALRRLEVHATFFVEGRRVERFPDLARRIVEEGHELAIHGWSHASFRSLGPSQLKSEIERTRAAIHRATGLDPRLMRPPFGRFADSARALFAQAGLDVVLWSVDSEDWAGDTADIVRKATAVEPGDIVLLHDRISTTADAVATIVARVRAQGLRPVKVSRLLDIEPYQYRPPRPVDVSCLGGALRP